MVVAILMEMLVLVRQSEATRAGDIGLSKVSDFKLNRRVSMDAAEGAVIIASVFSIL